MIGNRKFVLIVVACIVLSTTIWLSRQSPSVIASRVTPTKLTFVGDVLLASGVERYMSKYGYDYPYIRVKKQLSDADVTIANLENPITLRGVPALDKQYVFTGSPKALPALKQSGIDIVTLANNHTLDQGKLALEDTLNFLTKSRIATIGAGRNAAEAYKPHYVNVRGTVVAYIGLSRVWPDANWHATNKTAGLAGAYSTARGVEVIKAASRKANIVIVYIHWGKEYQDFPEPYQRQTAHTFIDAGADLIIGSHPHVLQGFEQYKNKWIAYSLGNFIFNSNKELRSSQSGILNVSCTRKAECSLAFQAMKIDHARPVPMSPKEAQSLFKRLDTISPGATIDQRGNIKVQTKK